MMPMVAGDGSRWWPTMIAKERRPEESRRLATSGCRQVGCESSVMGRVALGRGSHETRPLAWDEVGHYWPERPETRAEEPSLLSGARRHMHELVKLELHKSTDMGPKNLCWWLFCRKQIW